MIVSLLQFDIRHNDAVANVATVESLIASRPFADLYVLPEMWATAFDVNPSEETLRQGLAGLEWMERFSRKHQCSIAGSLPVCGEHGSYANRFLWFSSGRLKAFYDKRHLFTPGGESRVYRAGREAVTIREKGLSFRPLICYDLRFPVFSRCRQDYDVLVYVASWPQVRMEAWTALLQARAIENQCYVVGVNRIGHDGRLAYSGQSAVWDPEGKPLACLFDAETAVQVELSAEHVRQCRERFPVWRDADAFTC